MIKKTETFCRGLEFYQSKDMGLCGIENDEQGRQSIYQYLTEEEAYRWLNCFFSGARYKRELA